MKPILFNTPMARAAADGTKTVTRRVVHPTHLRVLESPCRKDHPELSDKHFIEKLCSPPYRKGDILYVRETWTVYSPTYGTAPKIFYKADDDCPAEVKWRPSIHMPKEAARTFLRVTDVWAERLQDITDEEILKEGVPDSGSPDANRFYFADSVWDETIKKSDLPAFGWYANPMVWVIRFEKIDNECI